VVRKVVLSIQDTTASSCRAFGEVFRKILRILGLSLRIFEILRIRLTLKVEIFIDPDFGFRFG
jgi:hypothetical protein